MRWYFAIDEAGTAGQTGEDAKTALRTALAVGGLEPRLLYHGARNDFTLWMERNGTTVIDARPSFLDTIRQAEAAGTYRAHSPGHWLRVAIPQIEQEAEFVLYTDCDVIFLKPVDWTVFRPKVFAAAPEFKPDNWNYFNAGIMVLNVPAMRASYTVFEDYIRTRILGEEFPFYDDQQALNELYRGHWEKLDTRLNWKPYWEPNHTTAILHFHGPKLSDIEAMIAGRWSLTNPTAIQFKHMLDANIESYFAWLSRLAETMQIVDPTRAARFLIAASGLLRHREKIAKPVDTAFMDFDMFPS